MTQIRTRHLPNTSSFFFSVQQVVRSVLSSRSLSPSVRPSTSKVSALAGQNSITLCVVKRVLVEACRMKTPIETVKVGHTAILCCRAFLQSEKEQHGWRPRLSVRHPVTAMRPFIGF